MASQKTKLWERYDKRFLAVATAALAALLYCSWPLAFWLNPVVGRRDLASQLEAPHQPYDWLFILLDVASGVTLVAVSLLQYRAAAPKRIKLSILSYGIFGALVAAAALVPLHCDPTVQQCGPLLHNPLIIAHGIFSIVSVLALFGGTVLIAWAAYMHEATRRTWHRVTPILLTCWLVFGLGAVIEMLLHIKNNLLQDFFITVCSLSVIMVVVYVERLSALLLEVFEK